MAKLARAKIEMEMKMGAKIVAAQEKTQGMVEKVRDNEQRGVCIDSTSGNHSSRRSVIVEGWCAGGNKREGTYARVYM